MPEEKNLYNPHDGLTGRDGGPYLDQEERRLAEIRRAAIEGREPDFEKAPATAGTPLVTASELVAMANPASIPSQAAYDPAADSIERLAKDETFPVNAFASREKTQEEVDAEKAVEAGDDHLKNPANPTTVSVDVADESEILSGLEVPTSTENVTADTAPTEETAPAKKTAAPAKSAK